MDSSLSIKMVKLADAEADIRSIRETVFIKEQRIPAELEWEEIDQICKHLIVYIGNSPVATARFLPQGYIGRMAVLPQWRGQGIGSMMVNNLIKHAKQQGYSLIRLNAQSSVVPFYKRLGFQVCGDVFMEAGIPHQPMQINLG